MSKILNKIIESIKNNIIVMKILKVILFVIAYSIIYTTFFATLTYTGPFLIAFGISMILRKPAAKMVERYKISSSVAAIISSVVFYLILFIIIGIFIVALLLELKDIVYSVSIASDKTILWFEEISPTVEEWFDRASPQLFTFVQDNIADIVSTASGVVATSAVAVANTIGNILMRIPVYLMMFIFTLIATYYFTRDLVEHRKKFEFSDEVKQQKMYRIFMKAKDKFFAYIGSYAVIISITGITTFVIFTALGVSNSLVFSIIAGIFDILPVIGVGSVYVPLAIYTYLIGGELITSVLLVGGWMLVTGIRNLVEPKILSSSLGIYPVANLVAIFVGLRVGGVSGVFFCLFLLVFYTILSDLDVL